MHELVYERGDHQVRHVCKEMLLAEERHYTTTFKATFFRELLDGPTVARDWGADEAYRKYMERYATTKDSQMVKQLKTQGLLQDQITQQASSEPEQVEHSDILSQEPPDSSPERTTTVIVPHPDALRQLAKLENLNKVPEMPAHLARWSHLIPYTIV